MLPPTAPDPREGHPILSMTKVCRVAARVAGGFSGPDAEAEQLVLSKVDAAVRKVHAIVRMASVNPQSATKVLAFVVTHTLDYLWGVTPTRHTTEDRAHFQAAFTLVMDTILSPAAFDAPECLIVRHTRAHKLLQLSTRFGGASLTPQAPLAAAAFLATTVTVLKDPLVLNLSHLLHKYVEEAYTVLYDCFPGLDCITASPHSEGMGTWRSGRVGRKGRG